MSMQAVVLRSWVDRDDVDVEMGDASEGFGQVLLDRRMASKC